MSLGLFKRILLLFPCFSSRIYVFVMFATSSGSPFHAGAAFLLQGPTVTIVSGTEETTNTMWMEDIKKWLLDLCGRDKSLNFLAELDGDQGRNPYRLWLSSQFGHRSPDNIQTGDHIIVLEDHVPGVDEGTAGGGETAGTIRAGAEGVVQECAADGRDAYLIKFIGINLPQWINKSSPIVRKTHIENGGHINLADICADPSNESGYRTVRACALRRKVADFIAQAKPAEHDQVEVCTLDGKPYRRLAVLYRFHHRACALHATALYFYQHNMDIPEWLKAFQALPVVDRGSMRPEDLIAAGLARGARLEHGIVKMNWVELVLLVKSKGGDFGDSIRERLFKVCPDYASKVFSSRTTEDCFRWLAERGAERCYRMILTAQEARVAKSRWDGRSPRCIRCLTLACPPAVG